MYNRLKEIYGDSLVRRSMPDDFQKYEWFYGPTNDYIGIEKSELGEKDMLLLAAFMERASQVQFDMSSTENWWHSLLYANEYSAPDHPYPPQMHCRFIHFHFLDAFQHKEDWKEALTAFFETPIELIWENATSGVLVEVYPKNHKPEESPPYSDIIDTTASDFYSNVKLFIGSSRSIDENAKFAFDWEKKCFDLSRHSQKKMAIHTFEQAIPYLVTGQLEPQLVTQFKQQFGPVLEEDQELLQSIKVFIENNLNVSLTAKKLFMHRNSLQYRIDKFSERTGIDIKNFQGALAAYLALIILETEK
ncbi:helix-turn-helix domain-containing protein [Bacillus tianshenii]|uniref:PucR family transcriptional regulator n=1 Tax=Sutcliffiella tianshenii TaxID=1463404 RepID=UPI001CD3B4E3|nr:helix-turn-helix domain-containing protein [Bacillus tianshenii]MCA1321264.1 helix-turn-helix domain-containing protein [Bacillus tianshenii]